MTLREFLNIFNNYDQLDKYLDKKIYFQDLVSGREFEPIISFIADGEEGENPCFSCLCTRFNILTEEDKLLSLNHRKRICGDPEIVYKVNIELS